MTVTLLNLCLDPNRSRQIYHGRRYRSCGRDEWVSEWVSWLLLIVYRCVIIELRRQLAEAQAIIRLRSAKRFVRRTFAPLVIVVQYDPEPEGYWRCMSSLISIFSTGHLPRSSFYDSGSLKHSLWWDSVWYWVGQCLSLGFESHLCTPISCKATRTPNVRKKHHITA